MEALTLTSVYGTTSLITRQNQARRDLFVVTTSQDKLFHIVDLRRTDVLTLRDQLNAWLDLFPERRKQDRRRS